MIIIDALTSPGNENNEDIIKYTDNYLLLLDGSTGLRKNLIKGYPSDAIWFVNAVSNYIGEKIKLNIDTICMMKSLILNLNKEYSTFNLSNIDNVDKPSSSMVLIREKNEDIEVLNIGDCTTIIETRSGNVKIIHDERVTNLDNAVIEKMRTLTKEKNISNSQARKYVTNDLIANRNLKNARNGYQILGFEQIIENNLEINIYPKSEILSICLFSDGIADYYETLKLVANVYEFYNKVKTTKLGVIVNEIRACQNNDLSCDLYPRLKAKDDASIAFIKF